MLGVVRKMRWDSLLRVFRYRYNALIFALIYPSIFCDTIRAGTWNIGAIFFGLVALFSYGILLYSCIKAMIGGYQKNLNRLYHAVPNLEAFLQKISILYNSPPICNIWLDQDYIIYRSDVEIDILDTGSILWAYTRQVEQGFNQVRYSFILYTLQKRKIEISMRGESYCQGVSEFFRYNFPHVVLGYSDQLLDLYTNHFPDFLELSKQNAWTAGQYR